MGCKSSKTLKQDDITAEDEARIKELAGANGEDDDEDEEAPVRGFGGVARRDSIRINKDAIEKRKKHAENVAAGITTDVPKPLPQAFMKPTEEGGSGRPPVVIAKRSGGKKGFGRRDSIKVNKDKMERQKNRTGGAAPSSVNVEVVE